MRIAFTFPGQGSQAVGMTQKMAESFEEARLVLEEVDEALSKNLSKLMAEGPIEELTLTANTQPALMAASMVAVSVLEKQGGFELANKADFVAGHSLGEYSALTAIGALSLTDAARLLRLRGEAMQRAVPEGQGAMAALLGLEMPTVQEVCEKAALADDGSRQVCDVANDNAPGQIVVSGRSDAIDRAIALAKDAGAKRGLKLPVSAPFHCSLMGPAADEMAEALSNASIAPLRAPVVANVLAEAYQDESKTADLLVRQVTGRVRWAESVAWMAGQGVTHAIEMGSGKVLSGLNRRIAKDLVSLNLDGPEDLDKVLEALNG